MATTVKGSQGKPETKAEKFRRLANKRAVRAIKMIRALGTLTSTKVYEYTPAQVDKLFTTLANECVASKARFTPGAKASDDLTVI